MGRLEGKVAIVTGAARGTGEATARRFVAEGAKVVLGDLNDEVGQSIAKELGDAALFVHLDVSSEADWQALVAKAQEQFGTVDILVNNAGILHMEAVMDTKLEDFERVVRVNQIGPFLGMKTVGPVMKEAGRGSIVNISSIDGLQAKNGLVAYVSTKWAVRGMTKCAALEYGRFGIRVNAVCPEAGSGEMMAPYIPEGIDPEWVSSRNQPFLWTQRDRSIADRIADIVNMVLFLASDEAASCTGGDYPVDGGNSAGKIIKGTPGA